MVEGIGRENMETFIEKLKCIDNINVEIIDDDELEISFYSDAGEDFNFTIVGETYEELKQALREYANDFDANEHVEMWIECRGQNGVPDNIRTLIDDADDIKETLLELAKGA